MGDKIAVIKKVRVRSFHLIIFVAAMYGCATMYKPIKTDLLLPEEGYQGEVIGAEITRVTETEEKLVEVKILIPLSQEEIETVTAIDKSGQRIRFKKKPKMTAQSEEQTGVIMYFGKQKLVPFRLYLNDPEFEQR